MTCMPDYAEHFSTPVSSEESEVDFDIVIFGCTCTSEYHSWQVTVPRTERFLASSR
jgi:hypothetical protein